MTISAVYACVRILAESVATLPLKLYRKQDRTRTEQSLPLARMLGTEPNRNQTSFEFREMMQGHLGLRGNAYARIIRSPQGVPLSLEPLHPADVSVHESDRFTDQYFYRVKGETLAPYQILHLRGLSSDGISGLAPVTLLRDTMGLALSAQKHGLNQMQNGARPGGVIETPTPMKIEQVERLREEWNKHHQGVTNSGRPAILYGGMKWQQVGLTNEDAQFIESRKFDVEEIARAYRIPLHMLQSTEKSTSWGSGIEQMTLGFVTYTLLPWLVRWEQALNKALLSESQKANGYYFKFIVDGLLRGDFKTRTEGYRTAIESGWMSINEVREKEDMNPIDGEIGDQHYRPLNTAPAEQLPQEVDA